MGFHFIADARNFHILTNSKTSAPARDACAVMATMPANAGALSLFPLGNTRTHFINDARDFVPWNARILNAGPDAFFCEQVTVAHTACLHLDAHLSSSRLGNLSLDDFKICSRFRNLRRLHWRYPYSCSCHDASCRQNEQDNPRKFEGDEPYHRVIDAGIRASS